MRFCTPSLFSYHQIFHLLNKEHLSHQLFSNVEKYCLKKPKSFGGEVLAAGKRKCVPDKRKAESVSGDHVALLINIQKL